MNKGLLNLTVLFVEDDLGVKERVSESLRNYFKIVYEAKDGEEGLKLYHKHKPDLLFLDINIPKISGLEMLQKIRQKDHTTKAVMLTAHSEKEILLQATELKLTKYIIKPLNRRVLKETVESIVEEMENYKTVSRKIIQLKENFSWDIEAEILTQNNQQISLTINERKIFKLLTQSPGRLFSYDDIIIFVWDTFDDDKQETLRTTVKTLRKKLPKDTIINIYGEGFKLAL